MTTPSLPPEYQALELMRRGDFQAALEILRGLLKDRPNDEALTQRVGQVEILAQQQKEQLAQVMAEPVRYAYAYLYAGRLAESLQLLRMELGRDPGNRQLRELALYVARRLQGGAAEPLPSWPGAPTPETVPFGDLVAVPGAAPAVQESQEAQNRAPQQVLETQAAPKKDAPERPVKEVTEAGRTEPTAAKTLSLADEIEIPVARAGPSPVSGPSTEASIALLETLLERVRSRRRPIDRAPN